MWLQKNERKLLRVYYLKITQEKGIDDIRKEKWYRLPDLVEILKGRSDAIIRLKKNVEKHPVFWKPVMLMIPAIRHVVAIESGRVMHHSLRTFGSFVIHLVVNVVWIVSGGETNM